MRCVSLALIACFAALFSGLSGQRAQPAEAGQRIRLTAPYCGFLGLTTSSEGMRGDTLLVDGKDCPLSAVTRLEVSRGQRSNALLGAATGTVALGVLGVGVAMAGCGFAKFMSYSCTESEAATYGAVFGGLFGGLLGLGIGAMTKSDRWAEVPLAEVPARIAPRRSGFTVGFRFEL